MTEKISENRQLYKTVDSDDVVNKVKQVLKEHFHSAAAMQVVELEVDQKYMEPETYVSMMNINLNWKWTQPTTQIRHPQRHMLIPPAPAGVKQIFLLSKKRHILVEGGSNISICEGMSWLILENEKICHSQIFSNNMCMTIAGTRACNRYIDTNFFPVIQDQIRYDGETNQPTLGAWQPG